MAFLSKKIVSLFLLPLPLSMILIGIGLTCLFFNLTKRTAIAWILSGFICLTVFSLEPFSLLLINGLQSKYHPLLNSSGQIKNIVVLGGGVNQGKTYPPSLTLNSASLSRLIEGIRQFHLIAKAGGHPILTLSGGRVFEAKDTTAGIMRNTAVMLGIPASQMRFENGSKDTHQEAIYLKKSLGNKAFILVTSAYHMPRSMTLFEKQGMHPIAAPTQYFTASPFEGKAYVPTASALQMSDTAIHEYLGLLWAKINREI